MRVDAQIALQQLDAVIAEFADQTRRTGAEATAYIITRMQEVIRRLAPPGSTYVQQSDTDNQFSIVGVVKALRADYAAGFTEAFRELVNADLFSDFLSMAEYLLQDEGLKQPAAVLAGGVLKEDIRKLCEHNGIDTVFRRPDGERPKMLDMMNADLRKGGAYGNNDQKQMTAWAGIRNSAAHAKYDEFDDGQVRTMIAGIRDFIARFPA